jgi:hypothetical protein
MSLLYKNFKTLVQVLMNKNAYSMRVAVHSTVGTLVHRLQYIPIKA